MLGLMIAAMFSATASMVSSQLNVFSGVLTNDIYQPLGAAKTERQLVRAGRGFTVLLGAVLIAIALAIPRMGGAERVVVTISELMVVGLLAPTLWGILNRNVRAPAVWVTALVTFSAGVLVRFGLTSGGFLAGALPGLTEWMETHARMMKTLTGVALPVVILLIIQAFSRRPSPGAMRIEALEAEEDILEASGRVQASRLPALIVAWSLMACGVLMLALIPFNTSDRGLLALFGAVLLAIGGGIGRNTEH